MTYFIFDTSSKLTKIGHSINPLKRISQIRTSNPNVILAFATTEYTEKELHTLFKDKRVMLEWFKLNITDYIQIKGDKIGLPKSLEIVKDDFDFTYKAIIKKEKNITCKFFNEKYKIGVTADIGKIKDKKELEAYVKALPFLLQTNALLQGLFTKRLTKLSHAN